MNLEKLLELIFNSNSENIDIEYSNINGKEKFIVNGKDLLEEKKEFDDTAIKEEINRYKKNIGNLDEWIWNLVIDEVSDRDLDLSEMDKILNLDSYTEEDAIQAKEVIDTMNELISDILKQEVQSLVELMEKF